MMRGNPIPSDCIPLRRLQGTEWIAEPGMTALDRFRAFLAAAAAIGLASLAGAADSASVGARERPLRLAQAAAPSDEVLWNTVRDTGYLELYEFFLRQFPASRRAPEARLAIAILKGEIDPDRPEPQPPREERAAATARPDLRLDPLNLDVAEFQRALRARGCNAGIDDGIWGDRTSGAAQRFADALGLAVDPSRPNVALFGAVLSAEGDVCGEL